MSNSLTYRVDKQICRKRGRVGILLAQLGTPDRPDSSAVRRYLAEFLSDRRVVEANPLLWRLVLHLRILPQRSKLSAAAYKRIWSAAGSPLLVHTERLVQKLQSRLSGENVELAFGMRYGNPPLALALEQLIAAGCERILLLPLYPQYAAGTTASAYDLVFSRIRKRRWVPTLRVVEPFHRRPIYIEVLADSINTAIKDKEVERLVLSYHGLPQSYVDRGDPYAAHCEATTANLLHRLAIPKDQVVHAYQSRFGRGVWLSPHTDLIVENLASQGVKRIAVACPSFVSDCLETLEEIGSELRAKFLVTGGEELVVVPSLNDSAAWIEALVQIIRWEAGGWLEDEPQNA